MGALVVVKTAQIIAHPIFRYKQKNKKNDEGSSTKAGIRNSCKTNDTQTALLMATWQGQHKTAACRIGGFKSDVAAVKARYAAHYRKSKPRASGIGSAGTVNTIETVEHAFTLLRRDSHSMVLDRYRHGARRAHNRHGNLICT